MKAPIVHLNGTSGEVLAENAATALKALRAAELALQAIAPNARDYYPLGGEWWNNAQDGYRSLQLQLQNIRREVYDLYDAIVKQNDERN